MAIDFGDIASRYLNARIDRATQPFTDPEAYLNNRFQNQFGVDLNGNVKSSTTTITTDANGEQTVTQKHELTPGQQQYTAPQMAPVNYSIAPPAPQQGLQMPQQQQPAFNVGPAPSVTAQPVQQVTAQPQPQEMQLRPETVAQPQPAPAPAPQAQPQAQPGVQLAGPMVPGALPQAQPTVQPTATGITPDGSITQVPHPGTQQTVAEPPSYAGQVNKGFQENHLPSLAAVIDNPDTPDEIKQAAGQRMSRLLKQQQEHGEVTKTLDRANAGDVKAQSDLSRYLSKRSEEGSYIKAILYHRLGLNDLARQEQAKLSQGGLESAMLGGNHYTIEKNAMGGVTKAWDTAGNRVPEDTLTRLNAEALTLKGIETGKTLYKTPDGNVWTFSTVQGRPGGMWTNSSTGQTQGTAPKGVTPFGQQDPAVLAGLRSKTQVEKQARIDNQKAGGTRYTEEQILSLGNSAFKSATGYDYNPQVHNASSEAAGTGMPTPEMPRGPVGSDLSATLQKKIVSGVRTPDQQQALWDESVRAGRPGKTAQGMPIAQPGTSQHEAGNAIDLPRNLTREERLELQQKGYFQPEGTDSVHWERAMPRQVAEAAAMTPTTTTGSTINPYSGARQQLEADAKSVAEYRMKPPSTAGANSTYAQAVRARARELNPDFDETKYNVVNKTRQAFTTGKQGDTVRSMNVAVDHLASLDQAAQALNNSNLPLLNRIMNDFSKNTGHPAVTNFNGIKSIVGSEVAKAVSGAGGSALGDREEIRREIDAANSYPQLAGVIKKYQDLMAGQLNGLRTQYEDSGLKDFDSKIRPETRRVMSRIEKEKQNTRSSW